jgi:uncharacterized protein YbjT (DUF2867 family)
MIQRTKYGRCRVQDAGLRGIVVSGEEVCEFAEMAARLCKRRVRPLSASEDAGPRKVKRHGWGGEGPPLLAVVAALWRQRCM